MNQTLARSLLVTALLSITVAITACCDRKSQEQSKITAATVTPVAPPATATAAATPPAPESYPATLAEGIDFTKRGYPTFITEATGMSGYETWGRWTDSAKATFRFAQPLPKQFTLVIQAYAFGPNLGEAVMVKVGTTQQAFKITEQGQIQRLDFNLTEPANTIELFIPKPTSPKDLQSSDDPRKLGLGLIKLQIQADTSQAATPPYRASITASVSQLEIERGSFATLSMTVANQGSIPWNNVPPITFRLVLSLAG